jgi:hypothetical protein
MPSSLQKFWNWYERHLAIHTAIVSLLFIWQLTHLTWLATDVIIPRLGGPSLFPESPTIRFFVIIADYAEIPALISATLLYVNQLRKKFSKSALWFILSVNSQWFHLFWITDEFVLEAFTGGTVDFPAWLAWIAILIDYLEVPVIIDTIRLTLKSVSARLKTP